MKLVNAKLYQDEIQQRMYETWYDEKYQYYYGGPWRMEANWTSHDSPLYAFAVLNNQDELIGFIRYSVDTECRVAQQFGAMNFTDDKITFARALQQVIVDCFLKFGMRVVEWNVICGNPIEKSYDRICERLGGRIVGIRRDRAQDLAGKLHDDKSYEIHRDDFMGIYKKHNSEIPYEDETPAEPVSPEVVFDVIVKRYDSMTHLAVMARTAEAAIHKVRTTMHRYDDWNIYGVHEKLAQGGD